MKGYVRGSPAAVLLALVLQPRPLACLLSMITEVTPLPPQIPGPQTSPHFPAVGLSPARQLRLPSIREASEGKLLPFTAPSALPSFRARVRASWEPDSTPGVHIPTEGGRLPGRAGDAETTQGPRGNHV